jgi:uncharacterized membrane protein
VQVTRDKFTTRASLRVPGDGSARKRSSPLSASRTAKRIRRIRHQRHEQQTNSTFLQRVSIQKPYERQLEVIVLEQRVALVGSAPPRRALEEVVLCRVT